MHAAAPPVETPRAHDAAGRVLHEVFGYGEFRGLQRAIVDHTIGGGDSLVLMPTGHLHPLESTTVMVYRISHGYSYSYSYSQIRHRHQTTNPWSLLVYFLPICRKPLEKCMRKTD